MLSSDIQRLSNIFITWVGPTTPVIEAKSTISEEEEDGRNMKVFYTRLE